MAQNVTVQGANYSAVPAVTLPKQGGGTATFTDVTGTTALASDVLQGKYFFNASGVLTLGTNQGGSGDGYVWQDQDGYVHLSDEQGTSVTVEALSVTQNGTYTAPTGKAYSPVSVNVSCGSGLVYESGTWTPSADTADYTISFTGTHTTAPFYYYIVDSGGDYYTVSNSNIEVIFTSAYLFGVELYSDSTNVRYASRFSIYRGTSATGFSSNSSAATTNGIALSDYVTSTGIRAYTGSTSRYWRAGRTYKWIAVWAPTT